MRGPEGPLIRSACAAQALPRHVGISPRSRHRHPSRAVPDEATGMLCGRHRHGCETAADGDVDAQGFTHQAAGCVPSVSRSRVSATSRRLLVPPPHSDLPGSLPESLFRATPRRVRTRRRSSAVGGDEARRRWPPHRGLPVGVGPTPLGVVHRLTERRAGRRTPHPTRRWQRERQGSLQP